MQSLSFTLGIPYVNRSDLLRKAVDSVPELWPGAFILDNSVNGDVKACEPDWPVPVHHYPGISLTFSQSLNYIFHEARRRGSKVCLMMHNDAEVQPGTVEALLNLASTASSEGRRWGVIFTHYDTLAAFNMNAVCETGSWDTALPQYYADNDYYRRLKLAGWEWIVTKLAVKHHNEHSSTIKSDPWRNLVNTVTFPLYGQYYAAKWGGLPGEERFNKPFNVETSPATT
jgi:hypothetical protein